MEIFRFEVGYQLRRISTWLYLAVVLFSAFINTAQNFLPDARSGGYFLSEPFVVAQITSLGCLIWLLFAAFVAGDAAARDAETGMHPLTYATPVSDAEYLGGRFLAAFCVNALLLVGVTAGMLIGLYSGAVEPELRGPFRPAVYLEVYSLVALPIVFVITAIQFSAAALSRRAIVSYLGGVLVLVAAFVATVVLAPLVRPEVLQLLDLFGFVADDASIGRTPAELNTEFILGRSRLASRLLWIGVALGALAFTSVRFRRGHAASTWRHRSPERSRTVREARSVASSPIAIPEVPRAFGLATRARQTLAITWTSFAGISTSWLGLILLTVVAVLAVVTVAETPGNLGVPLLPRTDYILNNLTFPDIPPAYVIVPLLIVFWSGELVWRERDVRVSEIVDAAPVPESILLLGTFLGLGLVLFLCVAIRMLVGMLVQVSAGYFDLEPWRYLQVFGLQLADYLLLALLALVIQVLANQKHVGHLATLLAFVFVAGGAVIVPELLVYASGPFWSFTRMRGFGGSLTPWLWFKLYWGAWALLLAGLARLLWVRGREEGFRVRLRVAAERFTRRTAWAAAAAAGLVLTSGVFIFSNTTAVAESATDDERMEQRADYERRYGRYEGVPQPLLAGVNLRIEIHPDRRAVDISGAYRLVNQSGVAIDSIHLATSATVETGEVTFDRPAASMVVDDELGHRIYTLEQPLQPGDSLQLEFDVRFEARGFAFRGAQAPVTPNSTNFTNAWLPAIGYQPFRELGDAQIRARHGLTRRPSIPSLDDAAARSFMTGSERIAFEAVVGTDEDQIAIAPGTLRRTWTEGGRRYFHYVSDAPIGNEYAIFSAGYTVHEERSNGVAIQIFHHPANAAYLERMVRSVRASLDYCAAHFGPHGHDYLRLVEIPGPGVGLHAETSTITYREWFPLLQPEAGSSRDVDLIAAVLAHEVGHLCGAVAYARVEGAGFMSESLAWYRAFGAVKRAYGQEHLRRLLAWMRRPAMIAPQRAAPPLLRAAGEYAINRKGPFAMYALSEYIGEDRVDAALRRLAEKHGSGAPPLPATIDLYRELQAVTPESFRYLLHDLFEANTFWELETDVAVAEQTAAGSWEVVLDVQARKVVVDEAGVETEVPMDDLVEIGVFASGGDADAPGEPIYLQTHRIRSGHQTIAVTVPRRPAQAGIDPNHLLIDLDTSDNVETVSVQN